MMKARYCFRLLAAMAAAAALFSCTEFGQKPVEEDPVGESVWDGHLRVTLSAGIGAGTKSAVVMDGADRVLTFTAGDRLYVRGDVKNSVYIVAGYLTLTSIGDPATTAVFSGELSVYAYPDASLVTDPELLAQLFPDPSKAYQGLASAEATLVHKDAEGAFRVDPGNQECSYSGTMAADADTLMTSLLWVSGSVNTTTGAVSLSAREGQPILNCKIGGLDVDSDYDVVYLYGDYYSYYENAVECGTVTTDSEGEVSFAIFGKQGMYFHAIRFKNTDGPAAWKIVNLGKHNFTNKVYKVERDYVENDPDTPEPENFMISSDRCDPLAGPGVYNVYGTLEGGQYAEDIEIYVVGDVSGYGFRLHSGGTVWFDKSGTATMENDMFLYADGNLTIMLNADYSIVCEGTAAIGAGDTIYLGVNDGSHMLTLTYYGTVNGFPNVEAVDRCTVSHPSKATKNDDGSHTYEFTVSVNQ